MDQEQRLFKLFGKFYPEGAILYREHEQGEGMLVVLSGAVRVGGAGGEVRGPGEYLGEEAFAAAVSRDRRAEVAKDSRLLQCTVRNAEAVVRHGPEFSRGLLARLLAEGGRLDRSLRALGHARLLRRMDQWLRGGTSVGLGELAEQVGADPASVAALARLLEGRGALVREGDSVRCPDPARLDEVLKAIEGGAP